MIESTTVTIGLDVHASSGRLAAIRGDEPLDERTLPNEHETVARSLRRSPRVRCRYEAGPTGFVPSTLRARAPSGMPQCQAALKSAPVSGVEKCTTDPG